MLDQYEAMVRIRALEQVCLDLSSASRIAGSIHLCAGQEAVPVGAVSALKPGDAIVATYRGHGWALASGLPLREVLAEVCHRAEGVNGGRAGSAYMMAPWAGFVGENSIVGAGLPIACGAALAQRLQKRDGVVVVSFGDGATSQGATHEAMVMAAYLKLPVVFVCENNDWSEMTRLSDIVQVDRLARRAGGYGIPGATVDGIDPQLVAQTMQQAVGRARSGAGPSFIEFKVPRLWGHYNRDIEHYRPKRDREAAAARDPLVHSARKLVRAGIATEQRLAGVREEIEREMAALSESVLAMPAPDAAGASAHVTKASARPVARSGINEEMTYLQAVNLALRDALQSSPDVIIYGEDVGKAGGIFGASRYLQRDFGEDRVFDMPIAESAILGSAIGASLYGVRPVVEIMWADFMLVALDQIVNQAANVRYVTGGRASAPLVIRTQQGATPGSCSQHSQSLEALVAHIPGIKVGLPATPQDAYAMLRAAIDDDDPVVIFEARGLYPVKGTVDTGQAHRIGTARVVREGNDIALIGWGTAVQHMTEAARRLAEEGIQAHVLDLRWLSPLDRGAIDRAVTAAGGRVIIVHEANLSGGFGAEIAAQIAERHHGAAIRRIGAPDVRIPAAPQLQAALLPNDETIVEVAREILSTFRKVERKPAKVHSQAGA